MKKSTLLLSLLSVSVFATAQLTSTSQITLTTAGESDKYVRFVMSDSYSDDVDPAGDVEAANPGGIYVYKSSDGTRWTQWASNAYSNNLAVGFKSCENTSYTFEFSSFTGTGYKLYDYVTGSVIDVGVSTPDYVFSIDAGLKSTVINDRFVINLYPVPSGSLETCFTGTELNINNNPYWYSNIVVKKTSDGSTVKSYAYGTSSIDFNEKDGSGNNIYANNTEYTVYFDKGNHAFIVKVKR
jgi:hypothetical protein